jgi:tetratricopeptide (TPR) repeat protein
VIPCARIQTSSRFERSSTLLHERGGRAVEAAAVAQVAGHYLAAEQALERALALARRAQDKRMERLILGASAQIAVSGPMPVEDAIRLIEGHLELARKRGYSQWEAECDERLAVLWVMRCQLAKARAMLAEGTALRENLALPRAFVSRATVEKLAGDPAAAEHAYRAALRFFEKQGNLAFVATIAAEVAYVLHTQGRDEEALQLTKESENEAASHDAEAQTLWRRARARVLAGRGALDEAQRLS